MGNEQKSQIMFYICVPVYKVEQYLDACIQSALKQTYSNFHMVLVDDGSPDRCGEICDQYAAKDERITVIHQENRGTLYARQAGLDYIQRAAEQENAYVVHLDSDDTLKENALEVIEKNLRETQCDLLFYGYDKVADGKVIRKFDARRTFKGVVTDKRQLYKLVLYSGRYNGLCKKAAPVSLYKDADYSRFGNVRLGEDLLISLQLYKNCKKAVFIGESLYNYTDNPNSITNTVSRAALFTPTRAEVYRFVTEEGVFTKRDMNRYLRMSRKRMKNHILRVARAQLDDQQKADLFEEIRSDPHFHMLLEGATWTDVLLVLFKRKKDSAVITICKLRETVGKKRRGVKSLLRKR